jgi:hypothetical protein
MFITLDETSKLIKDGKLLHIAADESLLDKLPKGRWIGGTTPYFITEKGGITCKDRLFVNVIDCAAEWKTKVYGKENIFDITGDVYQNGLCLMIMPFGSDVAAYYAKESPNSNELLMTPTIGWISGFDLSTQSTAKVFDGVSGKCYDDKAVVLHVGLPENKVASIGILNIFNADLKSPGIEFTEDSLCVKSCLINGKEMNFFDYLIKNNINTQLPLVADYNSILVNVSIKSVSEENKTVELYAPVFAGKEYHFAEPILDYSATFSEKLSIFGDIKPLFSCNCILNYLYGKLDGKSTPPFSGPVTFGEIAYQLLNQTLVYAQII